jgi:hypothetical protein
MTYVMNSLNPKEGQPGKGRKTWKIQTRIHIFYQRLLFFKNLQLWKQEKRRLRPEKSKTINHSSFHPNFLDNPTQCAYCFITPAR